MYRDSSTNVFLLHLPQRDQELITGGFGEEDEDEKLMYPKQVHDMSAE